MNISKGMVENYLHIITHDHHLDGVFPEDVREYDNLIFKIAQSFERHNDEQPFKIALEYYLCHPEIDLEYISSPFIMEDELMRKIIHRIKNLIWSEVKTDCRTVEGVVMVNTTKYEWWESRDVLG